MYFSLIPCPSLSLPPNLNPFFFSFKDQCSCYHHGCRTGVCNPAQHHWQAALWPGNHSGYSAHIWRGCDIHSELFWFVRYLHVLSWISTLPGMHKFMWCWLHLPLWCRPFWAGLLCWLDTPLNCTITPPFGIAVGCVCVCVCIWLGCMHVWK